MMCPPASSTEATNITPNSPLDTFSARHLGPREADLQVMLASLGYHSLEELTSATVPANILRSAPLKLTAPRGEQELLEDLRGIAGKNQIFRSFIGQGYYDTITPPVIQRNILENPGWYTQYTPYQAEISQGRLEALLNFQTMIADLTGLPLANASLLDEGTAAAEAMAMTVALAESPANAAFFVSIHAHPQTRAVVRTRAESLGVTCWIGDEADFPWQQKGYRLCGALLQYPATDGILHNYAPLIATLHARDVKVVLACDLMALTLVKSPGDLGADIAIGSAQRFGVPLGFGGPHAAFMATRKELVRKMPGRIVGISRDATGKPAYRLTLQTREQHIRRDKATSNICTAQVLLAIMAGMYGVYHGPEGLRRIAGRIHDLTRLAQAGLAKLGFTCLPGAFFDTLVVETPGQGDQILARAAQRKLNFRPLGPDQVGLSLDETSTTGDLALLWEAFNLSEQTPPSQAVMAAALPPSPLAPFARRSPYMTHKVFASYQSETELLRYIYRLQSRDLSLTTSMIPLGSCTMKLNGTSEMLPITWAEFGRIHPFAPSDQTLGYQELCGELESWLAEITGFAAVSLQPNAGSQGEYAGLLTIRSYLASKGQSHRNICLIPASAHGTNPASAAIAGFQVVPVACDAAGNVDLADLEAKAAEHQNDLALLMLTYPSTHGVFEAQVTTLCERIHHFGGQVYMDGANMNAQVGLCRPGDIGADVCHLNLHKTFCIPHGGGGPGMGPIGVAKHLVEFLPGHPLEEGQGPVSSAPYGSASILPISWVYIALMGSQGLRKATQVAILNANYMAAKLEAHYPVLFKGQNGRVAHEFILDMRKFEATSGVKVEDIAKRLMDYGFHAPTMSWPVPGTLMIEPTESESKEELDRFCDAMIGIRGEIQAIEEGKLDRQDNPLKHAPHTAEAVISDQWAHAYSRELAAYPAPWLRSFKFWPASSRIDNPYGDRNLVCACQG